MDSTDNVRVYEAGANGLKKAVHVREGWFNPKDRYIIKTDDYENTITFRYAGLFYVGKTYQMCDCNHSGWLSTGLSSYIPKGVYSFVEGDEDYVKYKLVE